MVLRSLRARRLSPDDVDEAIDLVAMSENHSGTAPSAAGPPVPASDMTRHNEVPDLGEDNLDDLDGIYV